MMWTAAEVQNLKTLVSLQNKKGNTWAWVQERVNKYIANKLRAPFKFIFVYERPLKKNIALTSSVTTHLSKEV